MKTRIAVLTGLLLALSVLGCKPEDRAKGLECDLSMDKLKLILDDIFIYEAAKSSKSLDSLTTTYSKVNVYKHIYTKYDTDRQSVQEAIECYTAKEELIPVLREIEQSYKEWRTNPKFQFNESNDTIQQ